MDLLLFVAVTLSWQGLGEGVCADFVSPEEGHNSHFALDLDYEGPE